MLPQTKVYIADCAVLADPVLFDALCRNMPPERREKIRRMRFPKDQRLSLGAGCLMLYALPAYAAQPMAYGENGKPYLPDCPLQFNLSHAGDLAMLAVSPLPVGCDVELPRENGMRVAKRFFFAEEYRLIASQPTTQAQQELFCRLWTLKESFMKVTGLGLRLPLDSFQIQFTDAGIRVAQKVDDEAYAFCEYGDAKPYCMSVCVRGTTAFSKPETVDLKQMIERI